eukprot:1697657-Pyramimonas_sp.AAC.1
MAVAFERPPLARRRQTTVEMKAQPGPRSAETCVQVGPGATRRPGVGRGPRRAPRRAVEA